MKHLTDFIIALFTPRMQVILQANLFGLHVTHPVERRCVSSPRQRTTRAVFF